MKLVFLIPAASALTLFLSSCGNTGGSSNGGPQVSTGPFDSAGRYREDWADDPSKWRKSGGTPSPHEMKSDQLPQIAKNEEPPPNSNPLPPSGGSKPAPPISQTRIISTRPATKSDEVVVRTKHSTEKSEPTTTKTKSTAEKSEEVVRSKPKHTAEKSDEVVRSKPKPKAVVKAKPKPKATRYVVKQGDSLSSIASRTGSSVSAIKSENGISGTLIRPGQSLTIPKK